MDCDGILCDNPGGSMIYRKYRPSSEFNNDVKRGDEYAI